ncbi:MAG: hypothetical protein ACOVOV_02485 [Dolichospermum sp.]
MELIITIEGTKIIVPSDISVQIQNQESFLWREQRGERTFPFRLFWTPQLRKIYGYIEQVNFVRLSNYTKTATLTADSYLVTEGNLYVTDATEDFLVLEFRVPPGNISAATWNKKLRACNWGKDTATTNTVTLSFWKKANVNQTYTLTQPSSIIGMVEYYRAAILINNVVVTSGKLFYSSVVSNTDGSKTVSFSAQNFLDCARDMINNNQSEYDLYYKNGIIYVRIKDSTHTVLFNFYRQTNEAPYQPFNFSSVTYPSVGNYYDKYYNPTVPTSPLVLPKLQNYKFYGSDSGTAINDRENNHIILNTEAEPTKNVLMPALTLHFILEKVMAEIGYTLAGDLATDADLKYACIVTNTAAARPLEGTNTFDLFALEIEYAKYAPNFTIKEFIDYLFDQLGVVPEWDTTRKILNTKFVQAVISSTTNIKKITKLAKSRKVRQSEAKNLRLKWSGVDETLTQYKPYPETEPENVENIELRFPPIYLNEGVFELTEEGVTPINDQQDNTPMCRMFFAEANGAVSNSRGVWNLAFTGANNLYLKVFKPQEQYLNSAEYDYNTIMTPSEVFGLSASDKLNVENVNCFRKEIQYKLQPNTSLVEVLLTIVAT